MCSKCSEHKKVVVNVSSTCNQGILAPTDEVRWIKQEITSFHGVITRRLYIDMAGRKIEESFFHLIPRREPRERRRGILTAIRSTDTLLTISWKAINGGNSVALNTFR